MDPQPVSKRELFSRLPPPWPEDLFLSILRRIREGRRKVIVLDDDPTGCQTVHDVAVLTEWSPEALREELERLGDVFFILTNSRSLPEAEAVELNRTIARNLAEASRRTERPFVVVSRSDSTLRGHFPAEPDALFEALGGGFDGFLLVPFFLEGGRYTANDIHYVAEGDRLIPAGLTEFARDSAFGYMRSNLREWVEEKTGGRIRAGEVSSISLDDIRRGGPARVVELLGRVEAGGVCIVNAVEYRDLEVFVLGVLEAESAGKRFLYRTAASLVRVRGGIGERGLLSGEELDLPAEPGGLVVVGSHVPRTTRQLKRLCDLSGVRTIEVDVEALIDESRAARETDRAAKEADRTLARGEEAVVYTARKVLAVGDGTESLMAGKLISRGLVEIVKKLERRPRFFVAKGGITSSDIATGALGVKRVRVLGQILPGVPVWRLGRESRRPGLLYVVFPGNVGDDDALLDAVSRLRGR